MRVNSLSRSLSLGDFLIKPVQRITKYPLLLAVCIYVVINSQELLKVTPENDPEIRKLNHVLKLFKDIMSHVNESSRRAQSLDRMIELEDKLKNRKAAKVKI
jgi:hypothetical protein